MNTSPNSIGRILAETEDKTGTFANDNPSPEQVVLKVLDELLLQTGIQRRPPYKWTRWELWAFEILHESHQRSDGTTMSAPLAGITPPR